MKLSVAAPSYSTYYYVCRTVNTTALLLGILDVQLQQSASFTLFPGPITPTHSTLRWSTPSHRQTDRQTSFLHLSVPQLEGKGYSRHGNGSMKWLNLNFQFGLFDHFPNTFLH